MPDATAPPRSARSAALLEKRLHQLGLDRARVTAVAIKPSYRPRTC
ncbi:MAG: hypothetical protein JWO86_7894, partial [Myxococcaceae bacterium]|nr:hypothetical protein [Myxococcaceae bacterium]